MTALIFPIPEANAILEPWRLRYTNEGPRGMPAHITVLYPFTHARTLDEPAYDSLARVIAGHAAFRFVLPTMERWQDGISEADAKVFSAAEEDVTAAVPIASSAAAV